MRVASGRRGLGSACRGCEKLDASCVCVPTFAPRGATHLITGCPYQTVTKRLQHYSGKEICPNSLWSRCGQGDARRLLEVLVASMRQAHAFAASKKFCKSKSCLVNKTRKRFFVWRCEAKATTNASFLSFAAYGVNTLSCLVDFIELFTVNLC